VRFAAGMIVLAQLQTESGLEINGDRWARYQARSCLRHLIYEGVPRIGRNGRPLFECLVPGQPELEIRMNRVRTRRQHVLLWLA